jgi:hypothetical protein
MMCLASSHTCHYLIRWMDDCLLHYLLEHHQMFLK